MLNSIQIVNGDHDPAWPYVAVDNHGMHVDLSAVKGQLWDAPTVARIEWGMRDLSGNRFGTVTLKNGTSRTFSDANLMLPYLRAWKLRSAELAAQMEAADAAGDPVPES